MNQELKSNMTLNEINFQKLITLSNENINNYTFDEYIKNGKHHPSIIGYCTQCEDKNIEVCEDKNFRLCNISHGAHSLDFLHAMQINDTKNWNNSGVMFVMESPSKDYNIYETIKVEKNERLYEKRPAKQWYWVHDKKEGKKYPDYFCGGVYGEFIASAIVTFKLSNAYLTNLVKCGLNNYEKDEYKGIYDYNKECIECCYNNFLKEEIAALNPKVIFTFGSQVHSNLTTLLGESSIKIIGLPHPAGRRRGFKDEYYNVLYFCMIAKWLLKTGVITQEFYTELMSEFSQAD